MTNCALYCNLISKVDKAGGRCAAPRLVPRTMVSVQCLFAICIMSATSRAQEVKQNVTAVETPTKVPPADIPPVLSDSLPSLVQPITLTPIKEKDPSSLEDPHVAAKQIEGSLDLDKIHQVAESRGAVSKVLGSKCTGDRDCSFINSTHCIDGMCMCKPGYIPSKHNLDKCLQVPSGLGDACEEDVQCQHAAPDSECSDSKCDCPPNFVFVLTRCWEKQTLGGICNNTVQCEDVAFATCAQGVCTCTDSYIPSPVNKCLKPAGKLYEAPCEEDIQCTHTYGDEARCKNSQCLCTSNYHFNGSKCIIDKKIGDPCLDHGDCALPTSNDNEDSRVCLQNICNCAPGFEVLPGEEICTKSSGEELAVSLTWVLCIVVAKYYLS